MGGDSVVVIVTVEVVDPTVSSTTIVVACSSPAHASTRIVFSFSTE